MKLDAGQRKSLMQIARDSLASGVHYGRPGYPDLASLADNLHKLRACFVTLRKHGELRGCIGSLEAKDPLATAVAWSAFAAGFQDPRFAPLVAEEMDQLELEISILSPMQDLDVHSEAELLARLRPGVDGLLLEEGWRHAVYLPSVWSQLPEPRRFVHQLKLKGGWPADYWSDRLRARCFQSQTIAEPSR